LGFSVWFLRRRGAVSSVTMRIPCVISPVIISSRKTHSKEIPPKPRLNIARKSVKKSLIGIHSSRCYIYFSRILLFEEFHNVNTIIYYEIHCYLYEEYTVIRTGYQMRIKQCPSVGIPMGGGTSSSEESLRYLGQLHALEYLGEFLNEATRGRNGSFQKYSLQK